MSTRAADRPQGVYSPVLTPFNADLSPSVPRFVGHCRGRGGGGGGGGGWGGGPPPPIEHGGGREGNKCWYVC
ncbi:hypothetical protein PVA98_17775, partial [Achromobacter xylosoxidans]|nr:hypothetical protein [Achromobacter xylosoxidans]